MPTKRARITDRDPLTPTDKVLAQYEQVNKSSSQTPSSENSETEQSKKSTSTQVDKSAQQANEVILTSQQASNSASEQSDKLISERVDLSELDDRSAESNQQASQEAKKSGSQQVNNPKITSQQPNKLTSEQVKMAELGDSQTADDKKTSQLADNQRSQLAHNPVLRKATFQVDAAILDALDRYHLQLQIELGKRNAPYKEILVEEAIAQWLERATKSPDRVVKSLLKRQEQRPPTGSRFAIAKRAEAVGVASISF